MSGGTGPADVPRSAFLGSPEEAERKAAELEDANKAATGALRETAKWMVGGIGLATGGAIAGTSLSSLGGLVLEWRLLAAVSAAAVGFGALGHLLWSALRVLTPVRTDLWSIAAGRVLSKREAKKTFPLIREMVESAERSMADIAKDHGVAPGDAVADAPKPGLGEQPSRSARSEPDTALLRLCDAYDRIMASGPDVPDAVKRWLDATRRLVQSNLLFTYRLVQFRRLTRRAFALAPIIALAFGVFAWAANPPKVDLEKIPPLERSVDIHPDDLPMLRGALTAPACAAAPLQVIVLGEWRSGAQEVVTVPKGDCRPTRLRLDHGRFSAVAQAS